MKRRRHKKSDYEINPDLQKSDPTSVRLTIGCEKIMKELLESFPDLYESQSHLIECAIRRLNKFHNEARG